MTATVFFFLFENLYQLDVITGAADLDARHSPGAIARLPVVVPVVVKSSNIKMIQHPFHATYTQSLATFRGFRRLRWQWAAYSGHPRPSDIKDGCSIPGTCSLRASACAWTCSSAARRRRRREGKLRLVALAIALGLGVLVPAAAVERREEASW